MVGIRRSGPEMEARMSVSKREIEVMDVRAAFEVEIESGAGSS